MISTLVLDFDLSLFVRAIFGLPMQTSLNHATGRATAAEQPQHIARSAPPSTLLDKIWDRHVVERSPDGTTVLYIDRHFLHEVTSAQAFEGLRQAAVKPWRKRANLAVPDHNVPTTDRGSPISDRIAKLQVDTLEQNCGAFDIRHFPLADARQGIVHVVGPEQGMTLPGMTIVCGDSHTSTHGAFGCLAHGIGTSEVEHVLATQTLLTKKPKVMRVRFDGLCPKGITAKDMALAMIGLIGAAGATGYAIEFSGTVVSALSMEGRMTLCNMSIEAGARCGMVGVDETTIAYLRDRPFAPAGALREQAEAYWRKLVSDQLAGVDAEVIIDATSLVPQVTWGTSPEMVVGVNGQVPSPDQGLDEIRRTSATNALAYMRLAGGMAIQDIYLDKIFIGSCTNSRIEDLRAAAAVVAGKHVARTIKAALVVPGSGLVKAQAEREGLDRIFIDAGFEWRNAGCSMCVGMNADQLGPGERCASTSNRNFENRQGRGGLTHLVSPPMAAAAAIAGHFIDVRDWL
jgi:3-isopropylmalate/(R)-2-methylmalate dehydratase large subunit